MMTGQKVVLLILDGWGVAPASRGNAITRAQTPAFDYLSQNYHTFVLNAAGEAVGLPWGEIGNSEVGHLNLGTGQVVWQEYPRITRAISDGSFWHNQVLLAAINQVKVANSSLHLMGILSDGGVHGHIQHLYALLELCQKQQLKKVKLHLFLDGRDVKFNSALQFINELQEKIQKFNLPAKIVSISGRYYAMDRDSNWERTGAVYQAITTNQTEHEFETVQAALEFYQQKNIFDEQVPPTIIRPAGEVCQPVAEQDTFLFYNYRSDRARQLTEAFSATNLKEFKRGPLYQGAQFITMTEYDPKLEVEVAFPKQLINRPLAKVLADNNLKQLHLAETEKYAHVTFFFNGGFEKPFPGEDRIVVPSKAEVASYAQKPEMSLPEIETKLLAAIEGGKYDFLVANFANPDMVAHTGDFEAAIKAVEVVDLSLKKIADLALALDYVLLITADHGNAEGVINLLTGEIMKEHSATPVPLLVVGSQWQDVKEAEVDWSRLTPSGVLADVAPTILRIMGLGVEPQMEGRSLL